MERVARSLTGGRGLLPWQRTVAAVAGEVDPDTGRMAYPLVVLVVPRRAGKTLLTFAKALQRVTAPGVLSWYTAHAREVAAKIFRDEWAPLVDSSDWWKARTRVRRSQGSEGLTYRPSGSKLQLFAPTANALHSTNADDVTVDEAWAFDLALGGDVEAGIRPAQLTRPRRQTWIVSAGGTVESTWLDSYMTAGREAAEADRRADVAYFEWGADPDADPDDPATWWTAHPALGLTVPVEALREDHAAMDRAAFARSILNVWPRPSEQPVAGLSLARWQAAAVPDAVPERPLVFAFDVAPDATAAAIAVAGSWRVSAAHDALTRPSLDPAAPSTRPNACVVEVVAHQAGTEWLVDALARLRAGHRGARIVADDLVAAAVTADATRRRLKIDTEGAGFLTRACGGFVDAVTAGTLVHRDQAVLTAALRSARRRPVGDGWAWTRRHSADDVCALVAVTLASWGWRTAPRRDGTVVTAGRV